MRQSLPDQLKQVIRYAGSLFIIFGTVFGIITYVVLRQRHMKQSKIWFYLVVQSITDILILGISLTDFTLRHGFNVDLHCHSLFLCKLWSFLERTLRQLASWIVVGISVERMAGCLFPISYFVSEHKHRPISFACAVFLLAGTNAPSFYYNNLIVYNTQHTINMTGSRSEFQNEDIYKRSNLSLLQQNICVVAGKYYSTSHVVFYLIFWCIPLLFLILSNFYLGKWVRNRQLWQKSSPDMRITVAKSKSGMKRQFRESLRAILILSLCYFIFFTPLTLCELSQLHTVSSFLTTETSGSIPAMYPLNGESPTTCVTLQLFSYIFYASKFIFYMCILTSFRKDFWNVLRHYYFIPCKNHRQREPTNIYFHMKKIKVETK